MYLVETALLTHGLASVSNEAILHKWPNQKKNIVWLQEGRIIKGHIAEYLEFRKTAERARRFNLETLPTAIKEKQSGALTASATMQVCAWEGMALAVTCGMGGIGAIAEEGFCPDLWALAELPVSLISTSPKDMLDIEGTISWLRNQGVTVVSANEDACTGYLFNLKPVEIDGRWQGDFQKGKRLILNSIPKEKRVKELDILKTAVACGEAAQQQGLYYHPAVNGSIDEQTKGYSSEIQLDSLIANIELAEGIAESHRNPQQMR